MGYGMTERGFRFFRFEHLGCRGLVVKVVESSIALEGAHIRIFHGDNEHVQLHVDAAEAVAHALLGFVQAARNGELTEPVYSEGGDHGHHPAVAMVNAMEFAAAFPDAPGAPPQP